MFEIIGVPSRIEGYVDLTPMQVGDNIVLRQYMKIKSGGVYAKYADEVYNGNQSIPLVHIEMKPVIQSLKVTIQQTAGVLRSIDGQFLGIS